ncbi:hypothetical protein BDN70DRAFT_903207 [Pholiota conissans]|uniref:RRM domain-containing protein n=1 Tax=Pholiota conissans TaxID=109636 RepID=A0A9P5ZC74_9AGAR|nr:hypothetical protein BDN70DRAFT_903207 [Pholiota conissans]
MADVEATQPMTHDTTDPVVDDSEDAESNEILLMKQRVAEMEREANKLRELQAAAEQAAHSAEENGAAMETDEDKANADNRSIYVGNVDYGATPEEIQGHFQACGTINRVTILCDKFTGHPKGYAYVEFSEPEHIDAAVALDNSLFRGRLIKQGASVRSFSTRAPLSNAAPGAYPFSKTALIPPPMPVKPTPALQKGKGLMQHLRQNLFTPEKQVMMCSLFSRKSPMQLRVGSVVSVISTQAPTVFNGVLIAIRRRGPDSSIRVRNILNRTGIEMQFFPNSPHLKEIKVLRQPPKGTMRRAKLFYLRDSPEKMSMLAGSKN